MARVTLALVSPLCYMKSSDGELSLSLTSKSVALIPNHNQLRAVLDIPLAQHHPPSCDRLMIPGVISRSRMPHIRLGTFRVSHSYLSLQGGIGKQKQQYVIVTA